MSEMVKKYIKKPIVVEAIQWTGLNLEEVKAFVGEHLKYEIMDAAWEVGKGAPCIYMEISTLEGNHICTKNDFIIKGISGEFYPCKPDIFEQTYEESEFIIPTGEETFVKITGVCNEFPTIVSGVQFKIGNERNVCEFLKNCPEILSIRAKEDIIYFEDFNHTVTKCPRGSIIIKNPNSGRIITVFFDVDIFYKIYERMEAQNE